MWIEPGPRSGSPRLGRDVLQTSDGVELPLRRIGPDRPRALVLGLHSFGDFGAAFDALGATLAGDGFLTLSIDQRGFGAAPHPGRWPGDAALVDDLRDLVGAARAEWPDRRLFVAGESMGGSVALAAAAAGEWQPPDGLVLLAPGVREDIRWRRLGNVLYGTAGMVLPAASVAIEPEVGPLTAEARDRLLRDPRSLKRVRADTYDGLIRLADRASDHAGAVALPIQLWHGTADDFVPAVAIAALQRRLPIAPEFRRVDGGVHRLLHQATEESAIHAGIREWLLARA